MWVFNLHTVPSVSSFPLKHVRQEGHQGVSAQCGSFPVNKPVTAGLRSRPNNGHKKLSELPALYFRPSSRVGHTPPKLPAWCRNLRHHRIIKQLPHILGLSVRSRANDIVSQSNPHYNSIFKKFRNLHIEILCQISEFFMQFLQIRYIYYYNIT